MIDDILLEKQHYIHEGVKTAIVQRRRQLGLSQLIGDSALGKAALSMSDSLMPMENPDRDQIHLFNEYQQKAKAFGYEGAEIQMAYYRKVWPLEACNDAIIQDILDIFASAAEAEAWEDCAFGISRGFDAEQPTVFCMCVVLGLGYKDGNALVTKYINEERVKRGVQPLDLDPHLRCLAREYLAMDTEPDMSQITTDMERCDYMLGVPGGSRFRFSYGGVFAPYPMEQRSLNFFEGARLVVDEFLKARGDILLRSDWQDIGFAVKLEPVLPPHAPTVPSIMAEYLIAWRLPPGTERPAHFPTTIVDPRQAGEAPQKRKAWWWPF